LYYLILQSNLEVLGTQKVSWTSRSLLISLHLIYKINPPPMIRVTLLFIDIYSQIPQTCWNVVPCASRQQSFSIMSQFSEQISLECTAKFVINKLQ
jgi:hypothetical protein